MNGQHLYTTVLCNAGNLDAVARLRTPAGANLQGDRHLNGTHDGFENVSDQCGVFQQGGACSPLQYFLGWAAHVDVDDVSPKVDMLPGSLSHQRRIRAGNLDRMKAAVAGVGEPGSGLVAGPQLKLAGQHLRHRQSGTHADAQVSERLICDARHGGQDRALLE